MTAPGLQALVDRTTLDRILDSLERIEKSHSVGSFSSDISDISCEIGSLSFAVDVLDGKITRLFDLAKKLAQPNDQGGE